MHQLRYDYIPYIVVARTFLEECATGQDELPVASADGIIDSASRSQRHINVLVTSGALIPSLAKCLLFRLDHILTQENGQSLVFCFFLAFSFCAYFVTVWSYCSCWFF